MKKLFLFLGVLVALSVQGQKLITAKAKWTAIKTETTKGANTATRIGLAGEDIIAGVRDTLSGFTKEIPLYTQSQVDYIQSGILRNTMLSPATIGTSKIYGLFTVAGSIFGTGTAMQLAGTDKGLYYRQTGSGTFIGTRFYRVETVDTLYEDLIAPVASGKVGGANTPTWTTFTANTNAYTFAVNDYIDLETVELPHRAIEGDTLEVHIHLATNGTNTTARGVKYQIFYTYALPDGGTHQFTTEANFSAELTIPANTPDKSAFYLHVGNIVDTNIKIGTQIKFRLKRITATGTAPPGDPFVGQIGIHYKTDSNGSSKMSSK